MATSDILCYTEGDSQMLDGDDDGMAPQAAGAAGGSRSPSSLGQARVTKTKWQALHEAIDIQHPYVEQRDARIVSREYDADLGNAVWTKEYKSTSEIDLAPFNRWERDGLNYIYDRRKPLGEFCVSFVEDMTQTTKYDVVDGNMKRVPGKSVQRIPDVGVSLDKFSGLRFIPLDTSQPPAIAGLRSLLSWPKTFLILTRRMLEGLKVMDAWGLHHCDVYDGNLAIPVVAKMERDEAGQRYIIEIKFEQAKFIDFGLHCRRQSHPPVPFPVKTHIQGKANLRFSANFRKLVEDCKHHFASTKSANDYFSSVAYWGGFHQQAKMLGFQNIDWREDLYQLGWMMRQQCFQLSGGKLSKAVEPVWLDGPLRREVEQFIYGDASTGRECLIERLEAWGSSAQIGVATPLISPHDGLIDEIDRLLSSDDWSPEDECNQIIVRRVDNDNSYVPGVDDDTPFNHQTAAANSGGPRQNASKSFASSNFTPNEVLGAVPEPPKLWIINADIWDEVWTR